MSEITDTLQTSVDNPVSGDINILQETSVTVGTVAPFSANQVGIDGTTTTGSSTTTSLSGLTTPAGSTGSIVLTTVNGNVVVKTYTGALGTATFAEAA